MKAKIKTIAFRLFQLLGYYPPKKILIPERNFERLRNKPNSVKEYELNRITTFAKTVNNHKYYNKLLNSFVPEWQIKIEKAEFIRKGIGGGSLNAHRRVSIENKLYFEKVYFNSSTELKTAEWCNDYLYDKIKRKITTAKIQKMYRGEVLTIIYFDFLDLKPLSEVRSEGRQISLTKDLYNMSTHISNDFSTIDIPRYIKDFRNHFEYQRGRITANKMLNNHGIDINMLEKAVAASKRVLTHGDIQETNIYRNSILVDWDSFGIYPMGFEPAFTYFRLLVKNRDRANCILWLEKQYKQDILEEDWIIFKCNFIYFLFVFSQKFFLKNELIELKQELVSALETSEIIRSCYL